VPTSFELKWQFLTVYAIQIGANGAFLVRQQRKRMTYEDAVVRPCTLANNLLKAGMRFCMQRWRMELAYSKDVIMPLLQSAEAMGVWS